MQKNMKSLQYDIEVPCMMQWELLWYSAQSRLGPNWSLEDLQKKTRATETVFATLFGKRHTLERQTALMVQYMQGWAWRPDRDMMVWCLGGLPDLLIENQDDGPNRDHENFAEPPVEVCLFLRNLQ